MARRAHAPNIWTAAFPGTMSGLSAMAQWADHVASSGKLAEEQSYALQVCLEELVSNIVRHGGTGHWGGSADQPTESSGSLDIQITIEAGGPDVTITVEDNGKPFDVTAAPDARIHRPLSEVEPGGLGIHLVRSFSSSLRYEHAGNRNRVIVKLQRPEPALSTASP